MSAKLFLYVVFLGMLTHQTLGRPWFWSKPSKLILIECYRPEFKHLPECKIDCALSVNIYLPECLPDCTNPKNKNLKPCKEALEEEENEEEEGISMDQGVKFADIQNSHNDHEPTMMDQSTGPENTMENNNNEEEDQAAMTFNAVDNQTMEENNMEEPMDTTMDTTMDTAMNTNMDANMDANMEENNWDENEEAMMDPVVELENARALLNSAKHLVKPSKNLQKEKHNHREY